MIYREMPAVWDPVFRSQFYARWGSETAVICAQTRRAEYPEFRQLLSIKAAYGGSEDYFIDGRRVSVDDDTFLIINNHRTYASRVAALRSIESFSIFFETRLARQTFNSMSRTAEAVLDDPEGLGQWPVEFAERLYPHDQFISPVLNHIRNTVRSGVDAEPWLDEQLIVLLGRMMRLHCNHLREASLLPSLKAATRRELLRRLDLGVDFMQTRFRDGVRLADIAQAAHLSPFYFLRLFKSVHGMSPNTYINRKRAAAALRVLQDTPWTMAMIAEHVGFGSRSNLFRHLRRFYGVEPRELRTLSAGANLGMTPLEMMNRRPE